ALPTQSPRGTRSGREGRGRGRPASFGGGSESGARPEVHATRQQMAGLPAAKRGLSRGPSSLSRPDARRRHVQLFYRAEPQTRAGRVSGFRHPLDLAIGPRSRRSQRDGNAGSDALRDAVGARHIWRQALPDWPFSHWHASQPLWRKARRQSGRDSPRHNDGRRPAPEGPVRCSLDDWIRRLRRGRWAYAPDPRRSNRIVRCARCRWLASRLFCSAGARITLWQAVAARRQLQSFESAGDGGRRQDRRRQSHTRCRRDRTAWSIRDCDAGRKQCCRRVAYRQARSARHDRCNRARRLRHRRRHGNRHFMTGRPFLAYYGDDQTGSTDVMEALELRGVSTVLFTGIPTPDQQAKFADRQAIGIAGTSRSETPAWMDDNLPAVFEWLKELGAEICHYKICSTFDSSPAVGSIGRAIDIGAAVFGQASTPLVVGAPEL